MTLVDNFYTDGKEACQTLYSVAYAVSAPRLPKKLRYEAEDIAQESLVAIFTNKPRVESEGQLKAYTIKVALNKTTDFSRRQSAKKRGAGEIVSIEEAHNHDLTWFALCPLEEALHRLSINELRTILINLSLRVPEGYRVVLQDFYFAGLKYEEIAAKRNIHKGAVGTYINRGLNRLREALKSLPELNEELAQHLNDPQSVRLVLPLVGICQLDVTGETSSESRTVYYQKADEGLSRTESSSSGVARPPQPSTEDPDEPSFIRILPEDKPAPAVLSPAAHERLLALLPKQPAGSANQSQHSRAPSSSQAPSKPTGCAALVLVLIVATIFGAVVFYVSLLNS